MTALMAVGQESVMVGVGVGWVRVVVMGVG